MLITILLLLATILLVPIQPIVRCCHCELLLLAFAFIDSSWRWRMIMAIVDWWGVRSDIFVVCRE